MFRGLGRPLRLAYLGDAVEAVDIGDRRPIRGRILPARRLHAEALAEKADEDPGLRFTESWKRLDPPQQLGAGLGAVPHAFGPAFVVVDQVLGEGLRPLR